MAAPYTQEAAHGACGKHPPKAAKDETHLYKYQRATTPSMLPSRILIPRHWSPRPVRNCTDRPGRVSHAPHSSSQPRRIRKYGTLTRVRRRDGLCGLPSESFADRGHGDDHGRADEAYDDREEDDGLLMRLPLLCPRVSVSL